jgi:hypothetical protein
MTYKEKLANKMNIKPFALFRLVKDKYYNDSDEPFYSFYDGDWFCGYDEGGAPIFGGDIDDAEVIDNNEYGNKVLHNLVDLYKQKKIHYQHIFVQDYNELNKSTSYLQHWPNYRYGSNDCIIPFKVYEDPSTRHIADEQLAQYKKENYIDIICTEIRIKNWREPNEDEYNFMYSKDWQMLKHIFICNRGRRDFDVFIVDRHINKHLYR